MTYSTCIRTTSFVCAAALLVLAHSPASARVCTDISPIPGSDTNCSSAIACTDAAVGDPCGGGNVCTAFAVRVYSACCSCSPKTAAVTAGLRCLDAKGKAEAKFVLCHAKTTGRASLKGLQADYGRCVLKLNNRYQKAEAKYGADCPAMATSAEVANTLAALLGDQGVDEQTVLVCGPQSQWDSSQQLCVPNCP